MDIMYINNDAIDSVIPLFHGCKDLELEYRQGFIMLYI